MWSAASYDGGGEEEEVVEVVEEVGIVDDAAIKGLRQSALHYQENAARFSRDLRKL